MRLIEARIKFSGAGEDEFMRLLAALGDEGTVSHEPTLGITTATLRTTVESEVADLLPQTRNLLHLLERSMANSGYRSESEERKVIEVSVHAEEMVESGGNWWRRGAEMPGAGMSLGAATGRRPEPPAPRTPCASGTR